VGASTAFVIAANKIAPGVGDRYLAHQGYDSQQYDGEKDPKRPHNLYEPVDAEVDYGAHGDFDDRARNDSLQARMSRHRDWMIWGALGGAAWEGATHGFKKTYRGAALGLGLAILGTLIVGRYSRSRDRQPAPRAATRGRIQPSAAGPDPRHSTSKE
jgi:hypothetical protein